MWGRVCSRKFYVWNTMGDKKSSAYFQPAQDGAFRSAPDEGKRSNARRVEARADEWHVVAAVSSLFRPAYSSFAYWASRVLRPRQPAAKRWLRLPCRVEWPSLRKARLQARVLRSRDLPGRSMLV